MIAQNSAFLYRGYIWSEITFGMLTGLSPADSDSSRPNSSWQENGSVVFPSREEDVRKADDKAASSNGLGTVPSSAHQAKEAVPFSELDDQAASQQFEQVLRVMHDTHCYIRSHVVQEQIICASVQQLVQLLSKSAAGHILLVTLIFIPY